MDHPTTIQQDRQTCSLVSPHLAISSIINRAVDCGLRILSMRLVQFKVTNFRSVSDSGWVEVDNVTALIGVNESGKTNLMLPLWKLKPAQGGEIHPNSDYPRTMFGEIRSAPNNYHFIEADFETGEAAARIAGKAGIPLADAAVVRVIRYFDNKYRVEFPKHEQHQSIARDWVENKLKGCATSVEVGQALKQEETLQKTMADGLRKAATALPEQLDLCQQALRKVKQDVDTLIPKRVAKTSAIVPLVKQLSDNLGTKLRAIIASPPGEAKEIRDMVVQAIPSFVYYSNYGNLDTEIYLPHVVENLRRTDLGEKEATKARTLRVLFSFVQIEANEILELGHEFKDIHGHEPDEKEIAEKKQTRSILLQSAGAALTEKFHDWWKQGDYRFRFEADGHHFRIWVADDRRPAEIELENRSSGLQWFLSFYLVFLVESQGDHQRSILLLDEPGMSLHPLAQRDLSAFFENLSETNPIIYTSHSPFLVDADRLERARKVYVAADGTTKATPNLRHNEGKDEQAGAAYAVHSALNLSVAESLLVGCQPVLVEGVSDQHYLTAIKALLVSGGKITPARELVFPPSGGAKTARVIASILTGRDEVLPFMLLDDDLPGRNMRNNLISGLYKESSEKVLNIKDYVGYEGAEIEDILPFKLLANEMDRMEHRPETRLIDFIQDGRPFVGQVEQWASDQDVTLDRYWKVNLAIKVKQRALAMGIDQFSDDVVKRWVALFNAFEGKSH